MKPTTLLGGLLACNFALLIYFHSGASKPPPDPAQRDDSTLLTAMAASIDSLNDQVLLLQQQLNSRRTFVPQDTGNDNDLTALYDTLADMNSDIDALRVELKRTTSANTNSFSSFDQTERLALAARRGSASANSPSPQLAAARQSFHNAASLDPDYQLQLENVSSVFDSDRLDGLEFGRADCVEDMCRIEYTQSRQPVSGVEAELLENELIAGLGAKYGNGTQFVSEGSGRNKTLYVKLKPQT